MYIGGLGYQTMGIRENTLQEICGLAASQVQELYPNLEIMFIPHHTGMFHEIVTTKEHALIKHPAGRIAQTILEKNNNREQSSFLGIAIDTKIKWFGLTSRESILGLFNLNCDEFNNAKEARRAIYHMIWHAIDLIEIRRRPEYAKKFRSGPMIPKRSPMNMARLNLQGDVFAAIMGALLGEEDSIESFAHQRATDSITQIQSRRAEDYPYVIALEASQYAYRELSAIKPARNKFMYYARQMAVEVGRTFDDQSIRQWWGFSEPAQDMAWRNFSQEMIIGCAVHTSEDPFVRATGHLISEITGIVPLPGSKLNMSYNAFAHEQQNHTLHRELMEKTFEEAMAGVVESESGQPLLAAANQQNENLAEGNIMGWCGNALQSAARAFEAALSSGISPAQAARLEFEGSKDSTSWDYLKKLADSIVDQKRKGYAVTMGNIAEICNSNPLFSPILSSIRITMKDPDYISRLEAANDLNFPAVPSVPLPKTPAPVTPAYAPSAPAPQAPGLGGSPASRQRAMEHMRQEQLRKAKAKEEEDRVQ